LFLCWWMLNSRCGDWQMLILHLNFCCWHLMSRGSSISSYFTAQYQ
jgi:hypothetical protein